MPLAPIIAEASLRKIAVDSKKEKGIFAHVNVPKARF